MKLDDLANSTRSSFIPTEVGTFEFQEDLSHLSFDGGPGVGVKAVEIDEVALKAICTFLSLPYAYVKKTPSYLAVENLEYWVGEYAETSALMQLHEGSLETIYPVDRILVRENDVYSRINRIISDAGYEAEVTSYERSYRKSSVDIVFKKDVVRGFRGVYDYGLRVTIDNNKGARQYVETLVRGVEGNVVTIPTFGGRIETKKVSLEDVYSAFESVVKQVLADEVEVVQTWERLGREKPHCDMVETTTALLSESRLTRTKQEPVVTRVVSDLLGSGLREPSYLDIIESVSNSGNDMQRDSQLKLSEVAGRVFTGLRPQVCQECGRNV